MNRHGLLGLASAPDQRPCSTDRCPGRKSCSWPIIKSDIATLDWVDDDGPKKQSYLIRLRDQTLIFCAAISQYPKAGMNRVNVTALSFLPLTAPGVGGHPSVASHKYEVQGSSLRRSHDNGPKMQKTMNSKTRREASASQHAGFQVRASLKDPSGSK